MCPTRPATKIESMNATQFRNQVEQMWATRPVRPAAPRTVAGVCTGIAARYRVDPTLVKVAFVVSTVFGGSGLLLYIAAWISCPSSRRVQAGMPAPALSGHGVGGHSAGGHGPGGHGRPSTILLFVAIVIVLTSLGSAGLWSSGGLVGAVLMLLGWWLLYLRTPDAPSDTTASTVNALPVVERFERWTPRAVRSGAAPATAPVGGVDLAKHVTATPTPHPDSTTATTPATEVYTAQAPVVVAQSNQASTAPSAAGTAPAEPADTVTLEGLDQAPPAWDPLGAARFAWDLPEPSVPQPPATPPARRSSLSLVVLGIAVVVAAVGTALNRSGIAWFTVPHIAALALAVVGAGLVISGSLRRETRRRATGLVPISIVLGIFVVIATTLMSWSSTDRNFGLPAGGVGERNWKPQSMTDLRDTYSLSMGQLNLDLTRLTLDANRSIDLRNGVGEIHVKLPKNMNVRAECSVNAGDFTCPDGLSGGADGTEGPVLTINAHTTMGNIEVTR